eukprot:6351568-Ditylum_brightwellii.AAC.1
MPYAPNKKATAIVDSTVASSQAAQAAADAGSLGGANKFLSRRNLLVLPSDSTPTLEDDLYEKLGANGHSTLVFDEAFNENTRQFTNKGTGKGG